MVPSEKIAVIVAINADDRDAWQWFATMSVAPNGRIDVVWIESLDGDEIQIGELTYTFSEDGGDSWSTQNTDACEGQCWYNLCLDVDPTDPNHLLVGAIRPYLSSNGGIDLSEGFIDGTFAPAKKGAMVWAKPKRAKEPKLWASQTLLVFLSPLTQPVLNRMK